MAHVFLMMMNKRGPKAFEKFMAALMNCRLQQFIAHHLDPGMARRIGGNQEPDMDDMDDVGFPSKTDDEIIKEVKALKGGMKLSVCY